eukprot:GHVQ01007631.1.p1 GENE.GHVQ01007631.1~~GHVQ01007631.1.p1  ORF type:complete len:478 (-),score=62.58 GHVQ01007631.1:674-1984(-)
MTIVENTTSSSSLPTATTSPAVPNTLVASSSQFLSPTTRVTSPLQKPLVSFVAPPSTLAQDSLMPSSPSPEADEDERGTDSDAMPINHPSGVFPVVRATKSYDNTEWLHSRAARHIRIMCEYLEVKDRMRHQQVMCTLLVFGSARCYRREQWEAEVVAAKAKLRSADNPADVAAAEARCLRLQRIEWMCEYWEKTYKLGRKLMTWAQTAEARRAIAKILREVPSPAGGSTEEYAAYDADKAENPNLPEPVALCTGGGPGLMEAANRAAYDTPGGRSMGMGISLPFEPGLNPYVHKELAFEFHYFFTRKFWMLYSALALIATPGGLGTMDELMEVLTLKQTGKFKRDIPVVLLGKTFWKKVLNFDALVEYGTITERDRDQMFYTDDPDEAFEYIKNHILADKLLLKEKYVHKSRQPPVFPPSTIVGAGSTNNASPFY